MVTNYTGPREKVVLGKDFNYFNKLSTSNVGFQTQCDIIITFPTQTVTFQLESGGPIEYSFNGTTPHGDLTTGKASASLTFENRVISKVWFRGTGVIRIEAWGTR